MLRRSWLVRRLLKPLPETPSDLAGALCRWAQECLKVPAGHPREGTPLVIPEYGRLFLRDALAGGTHEAALVIARKNAKSAIVAVLVLGYIAGPLKRPGWRAGVCFISRKRRRASFGRKGRSDSQGQRPNGAALLAGAYFPGD